jgi:hypothetical protein
MLTIIEKRLMRSMFYLLLKKKIMQDKAYERKRTDPMVC